MPNIKPYLTVLIVVRVMKHLFRLCSVSLFFTLAPLLASASHLFGADFHYTYVSGNTYNVVLDVYGDCSGSAFPNLPSSIPQVQVFNNLALYTTFNLNLTGPGVEVSPVCPAQINNTTCNGGMIPGVKKFTYSNNITLSGPSANWLFKFTGSFGASSQAGRSNNITNIFIPTSGSIMVLEATLNNLTAPNSAVTYTTIPTPFFCINKPAQYNPGAVDPNTDSLDFSMVPGLINGGTVTYVAPYTASDPLAVAVGTFSFSNTTGQLNFTPNLAQKALVVGKVNEYRNGILVGSSMREMTFVVLDPCNNNPPGGNVGTATGGVVVNATTVRVCADQGSFSFNINPVDLDGDNITVSVAGVPAGATTTITGNGTTSPVINFSWNLTGVTPGSYNFFVTYTDNGCPLSSKQTVAYTINVTSRPTFTYNITNLATCTKKAIFNVNSFGFPPFTLSVYQGPFFIHSIINITGPQLDSLAPGTYTLRITDVNGCYRDLSITIDPPPVINAGFTSINPLCFNSADGSITATPSGGLTPYQYAIGAGGYSSNPVFTGLAAGSYIIHVKDANDCIKDTTVTLSAPPAITPSATVQKSTCSTLGNGSVTVSGSSGVSPYQYAVGAGAYSSSGVFTPLPAGTYTFHIKDANNCIKDTIITVVDSLNVVGTVAVTNVLCLNQSNGSFTVTGSGGTNPYTYAIGSAAYSSANTFGSLTAGSYILHIKDNNGCIKDTTVTITQPTAVAANFIINQPSCFAGTDGSITVIGSGGTPGYNYAIGVGPYAAANFFSNLAAGTYTIHIKDNNNCIKDTAVSVGQPTPLSVSVIPANLKCNGDNSGIIIVGAAGGTSPYSYAVDAGPFQASNTLSSLSAGVHIVHLKDNNGCTKDTSITLSEPPVLNFGPFQIITPTCEGFTDGSITISATGGTSPYQYSGNGTTYTSNPGFGQLSEGTYTFYIRDNNNCIQDTTINLIGYPHISIAGIEIKAVSCYKYSDGEITVIASGGNPPLTYSVDNKPATLNNQFSGLSSMNHFIEVVDEKGCKKDTTVFLPSPDSLHINTIVTNNDCIGLNEEGSIKAEITGGTPAFTYTWSTNPPQSTETAVKLDNGKYMVWVSDSHNCKDSAIAEITYDDCCNVFVPTAFTPNNDGRNDGIRVRFKGDMELEQFSIYNRFGQRVFHSGSIDQLWDGTFNGVPQEIGSYYYYLKVLCGNKKEKTKEFKGDITLIR
jgi:gliding motility-associated-like protein